MEPVRTDYIHPENSKFQFVHAGPYLVPAKETKGYIKILCPHCNRWTIVLVSRAYACVKCLKAWSREDYKRKLRDQRIEEQKFGN